MTINWVDWIIVLVVFYYLYRGWETGLAYLVADLISFLGSLWLAVKFHAPVGSFLVQKFGIAASWQTVLGYLIVGLISEAALSEVAYMFIRRLPKKILTSWANRWFGALLSTVTGLVLVAFFLLLILALPVRGTVKGDIGQARLGKWLVVYAEKYGGQVKSTLDEATRQAVKFLTIQPQSTERVPLDIAPQLELKVDAVAEARMLMLVNNERAKVGAPALTIDEKIVAVARAHSRDMFEQRYFSHINPQGHGPGERMQEGGVSFNLAAENIAYAPDVDTAHQGLMNSEGHRRNILDPELHRVGIGIINSGIYGEMFTQNFAD